MDGVIPNVLDYWADPADHPFVLKSSMDGSIAMKYESLLGW